MDDCVIHSANLHGHATLKIFKVPSFFLNQDLFPNFFYLFTTNFACQQTRNGTPAYSLHETVVKRRHYGGNANTPIDK